MKQLQTFPAVFSSLKSKMKVKGAKEPVYTKYGDELAQMQQSLTDFLSDCEDAMALSASHDASTDDNELLKSVTSLQGLTKTAEHHLGGAKAAKNRFSAM